MPILQVVSADQAIPVLRQGTLMIHNEEPPMIVIVDEVVDGGFWGVSLEDGQRIEWDVNQFCPFIGKLTLEQ